jgi:hypothetical protein
MKLPALSLGMSKTARGMNSEGIIRRPESIRPLGWGWACDAACGVAEVACNLVCDAITDGIGAAACYVACGAAAAACQKNC